MPDDSIAKLKQQLFDIRMEEAMALYSGDDNYRQEIKTKLREIKKQIAMMKMQEHEKERGR